MTYRAYDPAYLHTEAKQAPLDDLGCLRAVMTLFLPGLVGWLVIIGTWYAIWCALP